MTHHDDFATIPACNFLLMKALQCPKHVTFCCAITLQADNCLVLVMGCYKIMQILCLTLTLFMVLNNFKTKFLLVLVLVVNEILVTKQQKRRKFYSKIENFILFVL